MANYYLKDKFIIYFEEFRKGFEKIFPLEVLSKWIGISESNKFIFIK
jgi:hypothetical protein